MKIIIKLILKLSRISQCGITGLFFLTFFIINTNAQIGNIWMFGNKGSLDFNQASLTMLDSTANTYIYGNCASICDSLGKLKYYFDGINIFGNDHEIILNGDSLFGITYYNQTAVFLPDHSGLYFLFHGMLTDPMSIYGNSDYMGLYYSVINGSNDEVLVKNRRIDSGAFYSLAVLQHQNKKDYWIVSRKYPDTFMIIRFSEHGIVDITKQVFNSPYTSFEILLDNIGSTFTKLCASNNSDALLETYHIMHHKTNPAPGEDPYKNHTYVNLYQFDNQNGSITKKETILQFESSNPLSQVKYWNGTFSPNDSLIYILNKQVENDTQYIFQIKRFVTDKLSTMKKLGYCVNGMKYLSDIKSGPNGKIYLSYNQRPFIAEISYPNKTGKSCGFKEDVVRVSTNNLFHCPMLPNTYFSYINLDFQYQRCGQPYNFISYFDTSVFQYFTWYFEGGDSAAGNNVQYHFPQSGKYMIRLKGSSEAGYNQWYSDSITYIKPPKANFGFDTKQGCQWIGFQFYDSSTTDTLHPKKGQNWLWDFGDGTFDTTQNPIHVYTQTGTYNVKLHYSNGFCEDSIVKTQSIEIISAPKPGFDVNEKQYCTPFDLEITDRSVGAVESYLYEIDNGMKDTVANPIFHLTKPGTYKILQTLTGPTGCITKDSTIINLTKGFSPQEVINSFTATVNSQNQIEVSWEDHPTAFSYHIFRNNQKILEIIANTFVDKDVNLIENVYTYQIAGIDSCEKASEKSLPVKNILLTGQSHGNDFCILKWTAFEQWSNGVEKYVIEKKDNSGDYKPINQTSMLNYQDDHFVSSLYESQSCYRLRAVEKSGNMQESTSNILCLPYKTLIFLPNVFSPNGDGLNDVFLPLGISVMDFNIEIYNQWGQKVFSSNNIFLGWDGTHKKQYCPQGTYYYQLSVKGNEGKKYSMKGNLILVR